MEAAKVITWYEVQTVGWVVLALLYAAQNLLSTLVIRGSFSPNFNASQLTFACDETVSY